MQRSQLSLVVGGMLLALSLLAACGGGGSNSSSLPRAVATSTAAASTGKSKTRVPATLKVMLGAAPQSTLSQSLKRALQVRARALAGSRKPQYLNEDYTDTITITELDGSGNVVNSTPFDVSISTGTVSSPATPASPAACTFILKSGSNLRECDMTFSASPGSETFYVTAQCVGTTLGGGTGDCPTPSFSPPVMLAVADSFATINSGQTNTVDVTMQPVLAANPSWVDLYAGTPAFITTQYGPCAGQSSCFLYTFDGNNPAASGNQSEGALVFTPFDGSGMMIPLSKPDPNPADYAGSPTTVPNTDPFGVVPNVQPTVVITEDSVTAGYSEFNYPNYGATPPPAHLFLANDSGCSGYSSTPVSDAYTLISTFGPTICYDSSAAFNGDAAQYYATAFALSSTPITLGTIVLSPMFASLSASPLTDCGSSSAACIQFGAYGYFNSAGKRNYSLGDYVQASIVSGSCPSDWSLRAFSAGSNTSGGTNTYDASFGNLQTAVTSAGSGVAASMFDDNGYAQFELIPGASGETCTVYFQADFGTASASSQISRSYSSNGTTITIFGKQRRVR